MPETYRRRTENANTTIAFSLNFMRNDQTNKSEMPKMKISSATAVSSTPFHKRHYFWSTNVSAGVLDQDSPYQCNAGRPAQSKVLASCTGMQLLGGRSNLPLYSWRDRQMRP